MKTFLKKHPYLIIIIAFQLFRLFIAPFMGLMPQDAYYHFYGEHLALSYFDHPGMIGYILRLFTTIFGRHAFVIKLADFVITSLTLIAFFKLAGYFLSYHKQKRAIVLMSTTVMVSILSLISTPDVPLLLFWSLSLIVFYKAIFDGSFNYWILTGLFTGLALDSKYTAIFLHFGIFAFLIFSTKYRKLLWSKKLWTSMLISALVASPIFIWNYQHNYASFLFQSTDRAESIAKFTLKPISFLGVLAHQSFILLPILFFFICWLSAKIIIKYIKKWKTPEDSMLFLLSFFFPTFLGFLAISLFYWVKINWLMPAYITGIIIAAIFIKRKWIKTNILFSIIIHLALAIEVLFYPIPVKSDDTWFGWPELAQKVKTIQKNYPTTFIFSDDNYKTSAELDFYLNQKIYAQNIIGKHALQFDYIGDDLQLLKGRNALFIDSDKQLKTLTKKGKIPQKLTSYFSKITELNPILIKNGNKVVRKFYVYYCEGYQFKPKS